VEPVEAMRHLGAWAALVVGALLTVSAFPKTNWWPLAWVGIVPLFWLYQSPHPRRPRLWAMAFGAVYCGGTLFFLTIFGYLPWALLALQQSLYFLIAGHLMALAAARGGWARTWGLAAVWVAQEWGRSLGPLGHTLGALGYSQHLFLPLVQSAAFWGVYGVSFLVALGNASLASVLSSRGRLRGTRLAAPVISAAALTAAALIFGLLRLQEAARPGLGRVRAGIVQTEARLGPPGTAGVFRRDDFEAQVALARALTPSPDLIVWPETAVPEGLLQYPLRLDTLRRLSRERRCFLLVGTSETDAQGRTYNTSLLISPQGEVVGRYDKRRLIIYGEYVPLRKPLAPIVRRYPVPQEDLTPGIGSPVLQMGGHRLGCLICFEALFPAMARQARLQGADILVVTTNDGWFGHTAGAEHGVHIAALRAIENNAPVVRAAKTGISCFIDRYGRVSQATGLFVRAGLVGEVETSPRLTIYTRVGDLTPVACALGCLGLLGASVGKRRASFGGLRRG